jgi:HEPN domain-containing protein
MNDEARDWAELAQSDLRAARGLLDLALPGQAIFHCQQAVEKLLKALIAEYGASPPRIHDLLELAETARVELGPAEQSLLTRLSDQAVASRYPGTAGRYTEEQVRQLLQATEQVFSWLRAKLT